jgi:ketosteroid isomerase-like protein
MDSRFDDWRAICETKARYCRCLDTKDWDGYADCFTGDFVLDVPPEGNRHQGRAAALTYIRSCVEPSVTVHHVHNPEVTFDGADTANVIWAMQDRNTWEASRAREMGNAGHNGFGHYRERYVRCPDGRWRITNQRLSYLHMDLIPLDQPCT